jgi:hypothetical protein
MRTALREWKCSYGSCLPDRTSQGVVPDSGETGYLPALAKFENLLWLSSQVAHSTACGPAAGEVDNVLGKFGGTCRERHGFRRRAGHRG